MRYTICDGEGTQAVILPEKGATVISLKRNSEEFLYCDPINLESDERPRCGIPVLFPAYGRLKDGCYNCGWNTYSMDIHGFAHTSVWQVESYSDHSLKVVLETDARTFSMYPFVFRIELTYAVAEGRLTISQKYSNLGDEPMPYNFGIHPYFRVADESVAWVRLNAETCMDYMTGIRSAFGNGCISSVVPPEHPEISCILEQVTSPVSLLVLAEGRKVTLRFDNNFPRIAVWKPRGRPFFCVEPINGAPDGLNTGDHCVLLPGQSRSAVISITPELSGW